MSDLSRREADRSSRLARAAAVYGTSGKLCPAERATQLLEAIIKPGDRVVILRHHGQLSHDHDSIENNHEAFVRGGTIVRSPDVDALMQRPA
jgi:hypothetical protein